MIEIENLIYTGHCALYTGTIWEIIVSTQGLDAGVSASAGFFNSVESANKAVITKNLRGYFTEVKKYPDAKILVPLDNNKNLDWDKALLIKSIPVPLNLDTNQDLLKKQALSKLTVAEITALGIKV